LSTEAPAARPLRADAARNRARVLDAAQVAFGEVGLDAQMEDVARRAGVGVGTVYRHFPTKDALLDAVVVQRFRQLGERARAALEEPDAAEAFRELVREAADTQARDAFCAHEVALSAASPEARSAQEELERTVMKLVRRAQREGTLRADVRQADILMLFCGMSLTVRALRGTPGRPWRRHVELLLDGLRPTA
jgi:AcrR family transcriptional regulator